MDKNDLVVIASALIISVSGIVINLTRGSEQTITKINIDKYTLFWFRILVPLPLIASLIFSLSRIGQIKLPAVIWISGLILIMLGIYIRWIAITTLGKLFTVDISIKPEHHLITSGIFRYVRHPSYTGLILYYFGLGLIMNNWISLSLLVIFPIIAVSNRIEVEEQVLIGYFKEQYIRYKSNSWRLIPLIY